LFTITITFFKLLLSGSIIVSQKNRTATINMTYLHQYTKFTNYFWHRQTVFNSPLATIKSI